MNISDFAVSLRNFYGSCLNPPVCEACDALVGSPPALCAECEATLTCLREEHCQVCALPFERGSLAEHRCLECLANPPAFQKVHSAFEISGGLSRLLHAFKFGGCVSAMVPLTRAALPSFRGVLEAFVPQALVPVPLGWWRRFRRGFNQSHILAEQLSRNSGVSLPILTGLRRKEMPPQARRGRAERLRVMEGAFWVTRPKSFRGLRLLVIDDVLTTGATAEALAKSLLQAGAEAVQVWTLARTGRKE